MIFISVAHILSMNKEQRRQFIHISGFAFVLVAQIVGGLIISIYSFMIAAFFIIYSFYMKAQRKRMNILLRKIDELETKFRDFALSVARTEEIETKFLSGPFWLFFAFGMTFLLFPLPIASAACTILVVGDAFSNIIGRRFGKIKIIGNRTIEGSLAFLVTAFAASLLFVSPALGFAGAAGGAIAELDGRPNDNLLIPLVAACVMLAAASFLGLGTEPFFAVFCRV
jgi:dolichol kinase